jgi:thioredoxin reductase (NADPH)
MTRHEQEHHDVIIIGSGAAGLSAALVLARAQASVVVIDAGSPRNARATEMHGFVSRDGIPPAQFLEIARAEVIRYGATIIDGSVDTIERGVDDSFTVSLSTGTTLSARAVLVATGLTDELPQIAGVRDRWGTLVHHCPYCHGYEVLDHTIVVIGGPVREMSLKQAGLLRRFSDRVTFAANGIALTPSERHRLESFGITIVDGEVSRLIGQAGSLTGVALADGTAIDCDSVFIAPPQRPNDALLRSLGCAVDPLSGLVDTTDFGQTSVPGVWAAGNVVTPSAQVITAAGAGSASAIAINGWLLQKDLDAASARVDRG